jgi:hypothetical protein
MAIYANGDCRRHNYVQAAYVDAALTIKELYGLRRARNLLQDANVPTDVINRTLLICGSHRPHRLDRIDPLPLFNIQT